MSQLSASPAHHTHGHDHPAHLAHHFASLGQQFSSGKLGMWLFLATEVLFFGGLFVFYTVWRANHPEIFVQGSTRLDWKLGAINTVILIISSMTMAIGVTAAQQGKRNLLLVLLACTFLGGLGFMGIKYVEYSHKIHDGLVWGAAFNPKLEHGVVHHDNAANPGMDAGAVVTPPARGTGASSPYGAWNPYGSATIEVPRSQVQPPASGAAGLKPPPPPTKTKEELTQDVRTYFSIYFCLTGLHGIHVVIGMGIMVWLFFKAWKGQFGPDYFTPVDLGGLYWHLVDLIWIFLFPLLYLIH